MTFKVGDKVEVIGNKSAHCHKIGSVCVVTAVGLVDWQLDGKAAGWVTDSEIKLAEIGTLKELDVKPGDVVEYIRGFDGMYPDYIGKRMIGDDHGGVKFGVITVFLHMLTTLSASFPAQPKPPNYGAI